MLARAVATSGRERAAHALLDPAVHAAREAAWAREEAARPSPAIPREHQRNRDALAGARARRDMAADHVTRVRTELESRRAELERVPFWARKRRTTAEAAVRRSEGDLDRALTYLGSQDATVTQHAAVVDADTTQRDSDETQARRRRRRGVGHLGQQRREGPQRLHRPGRPPAAPRPARAGTGAVHRRPRLAASQPRTRLRLRTRPRDQPMTPPERRVSTGRGRRRGVRTRRSWLAGSPLLGSAAPRDELRRTCADGDADRVRIVARRTRCCRCVVHTSR